MINKTIFFLRLFNISAPTFWHLTNFAYKSASKYFRVFMLILLWHQLKNKNNYVLLWDLKKKVEYGGKKHKNIVSLCIAYVVSSMCLCFSTVETEIWRHCGSNGPALTHADVPWSLWRHRRSVWWHWQTSRIKGITVATQLTLIDQQFKCKFTPGQA